MGAFEMPLNSLFIMAQVGIFGFVILTADIDLIILEKSCAPDRLATIVQSSIICRVSRCRRR